MRANLAIEPVNLAPQALDRIVRRDLPGAVEQHRRPAGLEVLDFLAVVPGHRRLRQQAVVHQNDRWSGAADSTATRCVYARSAALTTLIERLLRRFSRIDKGDLVGTPACVTCHSKSLISAWSLDVLVFPYDTGAG